MALFSHMTSIYGKLACAGMVMLLASCSSGVKDSLGLHRDAPDEYKVIANPPLSIPPDFSLRPPMATTAAAPKGMSGGISAKEILVGEDSKANVDGSPATPGEERLLGKAGALGVDPSIRQVLAQDAMPPAAKKPAKPESPGFFSKFLPTSAKQPQPEVLSPDEVVDPSAEKKRLETNKKNGMPVTAGETPTISNNPSTLDKILGNDKQPE